MKSRLYQGAPASFWSWRSRSRSCSAASFCKNASPSDSWQFLYLSPLPQGQSAFRPILATFRWGTPLYIASCWAALRFTLFFLFLVAIFKKILQAWRRLH